MSRRDELIEAEQAQLREPFPCDEKILGGYERDLPQVSKKEPEMTEAFKPYRRKQIAELRPYVPGDATAAVSVSEEDRKAGSPKQGDMIARNPKNHADQWLVSAQYFADNFEPL